MSAIVCLRCGRPGKENAGGEKLPIMHVLWQRAGDVIVKKHVHQKCRRSVINSDRRAFRAHVKIMLEQIGEGYVR